MHMLLDCNPMQEECATQGIVGQPPFVAWMEGYNSLLQLEIQSSKSKVLSKVMYDQNARFLLSHNVRGAPGTNFR